MPASTLLLYTTFMSFGISTLNKSLPVTTSSSSDEDKDSEEVYSSSEDEEEEDYSCVEF